MRKTHIFSNELCGVPKCLLRGKGLTKNKVNKIHSLTNNLINVTCKHCKNILESNNEKA